MGLRKGDTLVLDIRKMAYGGRAVARADGLVVMVRGAMPGDRVRVLVTRRRKGYAEARLLDLISPAPDRIASPCPYSGECGGCQWDFVSYARQLEYKRSHVVESLEHIGGIKESVVGEIIPSPQVYGYRNKMEFSFSQRRWYPAPQFSPEVPKECFTLGLHVPGTFDRVLDIEGCLLQPFQGQELLRAVKAMAKESGLAPYDLKTHEGFWRFLMLRNARATGQWMVNLVTKEEAPKVLHPMARILMERFPPLATVVNNVTRRKAAITEGEREVVLLGPGFLREEMGGLAFRISANSFFQTNTMAARGLYGIVSEFAQLTGRETVLDLYSGTGTIAMSLAREAREVIGMELNPSAVTDARVNCRENGITNCRFVEGDIRLGLKGLEVRPDVLVVDPPRSGLHKDVVASIEAMGTKRLIYVSCNPATLARDLMLLCSAYHLREVRPVDMFPHTYHVEAVAHLERLRRAL